MPRRPSRPAPRPKPPSRPRPAAPGSPRPQRRDISKPLAGPERFAPVNFAAPRMTDHVAPPEVLAKVTVTIARRVEEGVLKDNRRADRSLAFELKSRRDLAKPDHLFISQSVFALFRWRGWVEPLGLERIEDRLLISTLLDRDEVHPACRFWAKTVGRDPTRLMALGDAPTWGARSEGFRRLLNLPTAMADPWRLFPPWLREHLPMPPGGGAVKTRFVELLQILQSRSPLWVRAQKADEEKVWTEMKRLGVKTWIHRRVTRAAKLEPEVDIYHLPPFERGDLEVQDLASQAVAMACDPDPGERWWDCCAGAGGKALHLASLMGGKGLVVASDVNAAKLKETVRRARRSPFRNLTTRPWDGKHMVGKTGSYDGVLVDAPCSAIGTWRRNPDARWSLDPQAIDRLAATQFQILQVAAAGVKVGGTLVYSVCTLTPSETTMVVDRFLATHPQFQLDPFPHPLSTEPTDGRVTIWPQDSDNDAMFIARMVRHQGNAKKDSKTAIMAPKNSQDDLPQIIS